MTEWREIPGIPDYEVSDAGDVRSVDRVVTYRNGKRCAYPGKVLSPSWVGPGNGYAVLALGRANPNQRVHRLVLLAFVGPPPEGKPNGLHRNGDSRDNRLENLYWGDDSDNVQDMLHHGTHHWAKRETCEAGHPYAGENLVIRRTGARACATCLKEKEQAYHERKNQLRREKWESRSTHCREGHEYGDSPTRTASGHRICSECVELRPVRLSDMCARGHAYTEENTLLRPDKRSPTGRMRRACRECTRQNSEAWRQARKSEGD
jgi:hypothetical protein